MATEKGKTIIYGALCGPVVGLLSMSLLIRLFPSMLSVLAKYGPSLRALLALSLYTLVGILLLLAGLVPLKMNWHVSLKAWSVRGTLFILASGVLVGTGAGLVVLPPLYFLFIIAGGL